MSRTPHAIAAELRHERAFLLAVIASNFFPAGLVALALALALSRAPAAETAATFQLTGITTFFQPKEAYLVMRRADGRAEPLTLIEGRRSGELEVLAIDERAGAVRVRRGAREFLISFDNSTSAPPPPPPDENHRPIAQSHATDENR